MTKKEENQQNLNTSFKLKLVKKPKESLFDSDKLEKRIKEIMFGSGVFIKDPTRSVKLYTNQAGLNMIEAAMKAELNKNKKNEHRKKFSFRSKIFKQTYKFGQ